MRNNLQDIQKLGVGITGDAHKLQRDFGVQCNGLICLSEQASMHLAKEQMPENRGLAGMLRSVLYQVERTQQYTFIPDKHSNHC